MPAQTPSDADTRTSPSTCDTHPVPAARPRSPWPAVDAAKIREALAAASTRGSSPTPAMNFGAFVRKDLDATPEWNLGASAIAKLLRLDPHGKAIEKLEGTTETLKTRLATLEANGDALQSSKKSCSIPPTKSRRGRKRREAGLDCTGQMLQVLIEDEAAVVLAGRAWEKRLRERFGPENGFSRKTVEGTILFQDLRAALRVAVRGYGPSLEEDVAAHGLEIWAHKPGRGDKRRDLSEKQSAAARKFLSAVDFAKIEAKRRVESRCQAAHARKGQ